MPADSRAPDKAALAKVVARQRAEMERLRDLAATSAVLERAKGAVMALTGCSPDAAAGELRRRAETGRRTLLEECWITLGSLVPPDGPAVERQRGRSSHAAVPTSRGPADEGTAALGLLGGAPARAATPHDLAGCLLERLPAEVGADAVVIYVRRPAGGLELIGHAGVDDTLTARWRQVPPLSGTAALDALRSGEPRWLEDVEKDRRRYLLIEDPPGRWRSRAWLPLPADGDSPDACVGILRTRTGPFPARVREQLLAAARLCAGPLRAFETRPRPVGVSAAAAVQSVFDALPGAAMLLTPLPAGPGEAEDYRIDAATRQAAGLAGSSHPDLVGRRLRERCAALTDEPLLRGFARALSGSEPFESEPFAHQEVVDGAAELSVHSVRAARLGEGLIVTWVRHGSSDRQRQRLADVQRLGNLGWASWNLVTGQASWSSEVFALFGRDPASGPVGLGGLAALALSEDVPALTHALDRLLAEARPFDVPFRVRTSDGLRHLRLVAEAVPDHHGTPAEVHGVVQDLTVQRSAELALVESERAILTQHDVLRAERTLAARLQHALLPLPTSPVRLAGLRVEVAYLPAQSGIHVGGDWFSTLELPEGDALFVVGDVAGHGIDAVATMAQLRFTAKGMVITGSSLTGALARLNTLLLHSRDTHGTATMVLARYSPGERRLVWAQAGHPPPLLLRDGRASYLGRPRGMLLGATATPVFEEAECLLRPGDRVVLYTDGLVERPGEGLDRGLDRLAEAVVAHQADQPGSLAPLLDAVLEGEDRDDVCVLDIRVPAEPADPAARG
ncbi:SpoIIE family protein phosphatase [Streptomyces sp. NPDC020490]|uniref:SpoIIE family protein phosphatase n=1 Tax=Streptomyces sp. NPDC020490 TaxID=3365078 RepID=UPI00378EBCFD